MLGFVNSPKKRLPDSIIQQGIRLRCEKGTVIYLQSEPAEKAFYLIKGLVRLFMDGETGVQRTVSYIQEGNLFGEVGLLKDKCYGTGAVTVIQSELICFTKEQFLGFLESDLKFANLCASSWAEKLWSVGAQVHSMSFQDRYSRIANALLYLGKKMGRSVSDRPDQVSLQLTHQDLADFVGMNRVTVTTVLNQMSGEGIIRKRNKEIVILDEIRLQGWANHG